jgi:hypothetical protein
MHHIVLLIDSSRTAAVAPCTVTSLESLLGWANGVEAMGRFRPIDHLGVVNPFRIDLISRNESKLQNCLEISRTVQNLQTKF